MSSRFVIPSGGPLRPDRPVVMLVVGALIAALTGPVPGARAAEAPEVTLDRVDLAPGVHLVRSNSPIGNPSTVLVDGPDGVLVVDPNLALAGEALSALIARLDLGPVRYVVATHHHGDHSEGLETFPDAVALAPVPQRERLRTDAIVLGQRPIHADALPELTFDGSITLHLGANTARLLLPPDRSGHTDGDVLVHLPEAGVLCVGDHLFLDRFPIIDLDGGGSFEGYLANLRWISDAFAPDTRIVAGHGTFEPDPVRLATVDEVRAWRETLEATIRWVSARLDEGHTVEEIAEMDLPPAFASMTERPRYVSAPRWIAAVAASRER